MALGTLAFIGDLVLIRDPAFITSFKVANYTSINSEPLQFTLQILEKLN